MVIFIPHQKYEFGNTKFHGRFISIYLMSTRIELDYFNFHGDKMDENM